MTCAAIILLDATRSPSGFTEELQGAQESMDMAKAHSDGI